MLTRRNFLAVAVAGATSLLVGCSGEKDEAPAADSTTEPVEDVPAADSAAAGNVLVAYFSATGNTEGVATAIAERLGADVFAIEAAQPYTEADLNYNDDASRVSVERADGTNPELAQVTPDGWADYDTVLLGYPIPDLVGRGRLAVAHVRGGQRLCRQDRGTVLHLRLLGHRPLGRASG